MKNSNLLILAAVFLVAVSLACTGARPSPTGESERSPHPSGTSQLTQDDERTPSLMANTENLQKATFAGGCFWCTEAFFQELKGVETVTSGYTGGQVKDPTYEQVCSGQTGHAEAIEILYDPAQVTFGQLLEVHFKSHDPTTLNRQGADSGTQYRSAIFYHSPEQKAEAEAIIAELEKNKVYSNAIVTEVVPAEVFYSAEQYHQDYYANNPKNQYCDFVITPKLEKFRKVFAEQLKADRAPK